MSSTLPITPEEAAALADELESQSAEQVLERAAAIFGERILLTCSWQKQSSVLVHMLSEVAPGMRVVEFDTGLLFPETYDVREKLISRYSINFERIEPELSVEQQGAAARGTALGARSRCVLRHAQGGSAGAGTARYGCVGHGYSTGTVDNQAKCTQD